MSNFRARCAELVAAMDSYPIRPKAHRDLCNQVRKELEQGKLEEPTDKELMEVFWEHENGLEEIWADDWAPAARAVLAKWGSRS